MSKNKLKVISLFSGCGGMDLGFIGNFDFLGKHYIQNPFEIVYAGDINQKAVETYNHNFSRKAQCVDIKEKNLEELPYADIVIGGFPCQDFSLSGKRKGFDSERGKLYLQMKKVVSYIKPKIFVAENVNGLRIPINGSKKSALEHILEEFRSSGYNVSYKLLNAKNFGVPQDRKRVIIIGIRNDIKADIMFPEEILDETNLVTSKRAIDDLWNKIGNKKIFNHGEKDYSRAKFYKGKKMQGNKKIEPDKPAPTIRAEHHGNIEGHYRTINKNNPDDVNNWRRLSVRECARLQSFPDNFVFPCTATYAYRQVGNAVPPVFAWHIAKNIYEILKNKNERHINENRKQQKRNIIY